MRCKKCDYRLWNLTERRCPECGAPFRPSEFEFAPNTVQFCCPHCGQAYYGTGAKGHLVPAAFSCVKCGAAIEMDEMILLPTSGVQEEQTNVVRMPWLERKKRGVARAWLATVGAALVWPGRLMQILPQNSSTWAALGFAVFTLFLTAAVAVGPFAVFPMIIFARGGLAAPHVLWVMATVIGVAFAVLMFLTLAWGVAAHGLLRITGTTSGTLGRTQQAICYSTGANTLTAIPCLGFYIGWIWWVVSAVLMVKEAQRVHGGRAALAVLAPPLALFGCVVGGYVWLFVSVIPGIQSKSLTNIGKSQTLTVLQAVQRYAGEHGGLGPRHASQLVVDGYLTPASFAMFGSGTTAAAVPVGSTTLEGLGALPDEEAQASVAEAAEGLPEGTVAHRVGDFVFVYRGVDLSAGNGGLWVVVAAPFVSASTAAASPAVWVGCVDGSVTPITGVALPAALAAQNALRAEAGLPPLPDPTTVRQAQPGSASP
jgi:hypothetical protein